MSLEVTPEQAENLFSALRENQNRERQHPLTTPPEKIERVKELLKERKNQVEIKEETGVGRTKISEIKIKMLRRGELN